jgi:hypothetical protein
MRASIKIVRNQVELNYDCFYTGERIKRQFDLIGSYIKEWSCKYKKYEHVCNDLYKIGNTLTASNTEEMLKIIRSEYKSMRRYEKRELKC